MFYVNIFFWFFFIQSNKTRCLVVVKFPSKEYKIRKVKIQKWIQDMFSNRMRTSCHKARNFEHELLHRHLSNFVSLPWILHNRYYQCVLQTKRTQVQCFLRINLVGLVTCWHIVPQLNQTNYAFFFKLLTKNLHFLHHRNRDIQSCILLNYISVISSIFINKFAQKCQYFTLMDQSVPLITVTSLVYLGRNPLWLCLLTELRKNTNKTILTKCICFYSSCLHTKLI